MNASAPRYRRYRHASNVSLHNGDMRTIGERLRAARAKKGLTQPELSRLSGVSQAAISDLERGRSVESRKLVQLAQALGITPEWLERGVGPVDRPVLKSVTTSDTLVIEADVLPRTSKIPVVGTVQAGDDGFFEEIGYPVGVGDGTVAYHGRDMNAYALRVRGDSMAGKIDSGEKIVAEPNTPPQPGDIAVVLLKDGRKTLKRLLYIRDGEVTLASFNRDHHNLVLQLDEIDAMHKVVTIHLR